MGGKYRRERTRNDVVRGVDSGRRYDQNEIARRVRGINIGFTDPASVTGGFSTSGGSSGGGGSGTLIDPIVQRVESLGNVDGDVLINPELANYFTMKLTDDIVLTMGAGSTSGNAQPITIQIEQDGTGGHAIIWGSKIDGTPTTSDAANSESIVQLLTLDGGETWEILTSGGGGGTGGLPPYTSDDNMKVLQVEGDELAWDLVDIPDLKTYVAPSGNTRPMLDFPDGIGLTSLGELQFHSDFYTNIVSHSSDIVLTNPDGSNRNASVGIFEIGLIHSQAGIPLNNFTLSGIRDGAAFGEASIEVKSLKDPSFKLVDSGFYQDTSRNSEIDIGSIHFDAQATRSVNGNNRLYQTTFASIHASAEKATFIYTNFNRSVRYSSGARVKYNDKYYRLDGETSRYTYPDVLPSQWVEVINNSGTYDRGKLRISLRDVDESFSGNDRFSDIIIADIDSGLLLNHSIYQPQYSLEKSIKNYAVLHGEVVLGTPYISSNNVGSQVAVLNTANMTLVTLGNSSQPKPTGTTGAAVALWGQNGVLMYKSDGVVAPFGGDTVNPLTQNIVPDEGNQRSIGNVLHKMNRIYTNELYVYQDADFSGDVALGNGTSDDVTMKARLASDIIPKTRNRYNIGSTSKQFAHIYTFGLTSDGDVRLGNDSSDNVTFGGRVRSNILPSSNKNYDLGSSSRIWDKLYVEDLYCSGNAVIAGGSPNDTLGFYGESGVTKITFPYWVAQSTRTATGPDMGRMSSSITAIANALQEIGLFKAARQN